MQVTYGTCVGHLKTHGGWGDVISKWTLFTKQHFCCCWKYQFLWGSSNSFNLLLDILARLAGLFLAPADGVWVLPCMFVLLFYEEEMQRALALRKNCFFLLRFKERKTNFSKYFKFGAIFALKCNVSNFVNTIIYAPTLFFFLILWIIKSLFHSVVPHYINAHAVLFWSISDVSYGFFHWHIDNKFGENQGMAFLQQKKQHLPWCPKQQFRAQHWAFTS